MKKLAVISCILGLAGFFLTSCNEDDIQEYTGPIAVNIQSNNETEFGVAFLENDPTPEKTFNINVSIQGPVSAQKRMVKFQLGDKQTAVAGNNYEMPMEAVIEAGKRDTTIVCKVYKEGLDYEGIYLDLRVAPNEDFEGGGVYDRLLVRFMFGFPTSWYASAGQIYMADYLLGKCTQAKYQFIYETIGTIDLVEYADTPFASGLGTLAAELNALLEKDPRIDDDGSVMVFKM